MSDTVIEHGEDGASSVPAGTTGTSDAVLIIGGGIAGMQAALHLAVSGRRVVLVERGSTLGGRLASVRSARLEAEEDTVGEGQPGVGAVGHHPNIEVLTLSEVTGLEGEPGRFLATIRQRARFVTPDCVRCGECKRVCPVVVPNEYQAGLTFRKAIHSPLPEPVPRAYLIDIDRCLNDPPNYLPCQRCVSVCETKCIHFDVPLEETLTREVRSVIVAVGYDLVDPLSLPEYGYGTHPDIMTSMELENMLSPTGPVGGYLERPSNGETPSRILFILGIGSRKRHGMLFCSGFSWNYTAKHVALLNRQDITDVSVLYQDQRAYGQGFFDYWNQNCGDGARLVRGHLEIVEPGSDGRIAVRYEDTDETQILTEQYDMVVLVPEVLPSAGLPALAQALDLGLTGDGFIGVEETHGTLIATTRPGVYVAGCASGPKDIPDTMAEGRAAAMSVIDKASRRRTSPMRAMDLSDLPKPLGQAIASTKKPMSPEDMQAMFTNLVEALLQRGG